VRPRFGRQQIQHHGRDERPREEVAGEHREDDGHPERREQRPTHSAEEHDRTNTMQIDRVATNAGVATSAAPSRMACLRACPGSIWRWLFSILDGSVVHQDAHRQRQPA